MDISYALFYNRKLKLSICMSLKGQYLLFFFREIAIFQTTFSKSFGKKIKQTGSNKSEQGGKNSQNNQENMFFY